MMSTSQSGVESSLDEGGVEEDEEMQSELGSIEGFINDSGSEYSILEVTGVKRDQRS